MKKKAKDEAISIRRFTVRWPNLLAEASISIATKPGAPQLEVEATALAILRQLIMQEHVSTPLTQTKRTKTSE